MRWGHHCLLRPLHVKQASYSALTQFPTSPSSCCVGNTRRGTWHRNVVHRGPLASACSSCDCSQSRLVGAGDLTPPQANDAVLKNCTENQSLVQPHQGARALCLDISPPRGSSPHQPQKVLFLYRHSSVCKSLRSSCWCCSLSIQPRAVCTEPLVAPSVGPRQKSQECRVPGKLVLLPP